MSVGDVHVRAGAQRSQGHRSVELELHVLVTTQHRRWEPSLGSLQEQDALLTLEPSPQPSKRHFRSLSSDERVETQHLHIACGRVSSGNQQLLF